MARKGRTFTSVVLDDMVQRMTPERDAALEKFMAQHPEVYRGMYFWTNPRGIAADLRSSREPYTTGLVNMTYDFEGQEQPPTPWWVRLWAWLGRAF